jgi:hypothetical protein
MPLKPLPDKPPCAGNRHRPHPHRHDDVPDGTPKPCSGRWWCVACLHWYSAPACKLPGAPAFPADWMR